MDFFNQLLTSYALLKRRKFSAKLFEEVAADKNITYTNLLNQDTKEAQEAIKATNLEIEGVFPGIDPATNTADPVAKVDVGKAVSAPLVQTGVKPSAEKSPSISNKQQNGKGGTNNGTTTPASPCGGQVKIQGSTVTVLTADCNLNVRGFREWRGMVLRSHYSQGLSQESGGELTPEMQDLLGGMKDSNILKDIGGVDLLDSLGDLYRLSEELGSIEDLQDFDLVSLLTAKGSGAKKTIPRKIINSLLGKEGFTIASEEDMLEGDVIAYTRPAEDYVTGSIKNLASVLERIKKFHTTPGEFGIDDLKYIQDRLIISRYRKEGHDRFKIFIKSDQADSLGVSFDWENRIKPGDKERTRSPLQNLIEDTQNRLNAWGKEKGFTEDAVQIKAVERKDVGGGGNVQKVIEEVSESIDTISTLLLDAQTTGNKHSRDAATKMWSDLLNTYHDRLDAALSLNQKVEAGELIGTDQTEILADSLQGLQEYLQLRDLSDEVLGIFDVDSRETFNRSEYKNKVKETFKAIMERIIPLRMKTMRKLAPDFVIRTGNMQDAGKYGRKVDQILFYHSSKDAKGKGKVKKATLQELIDNGLITESDLDTVRVQYGGKNGTPLNLNTPIHYINQSLKWTKNSKRTNLGNTASIKAVSQEFAGVQDNPKTSAADKQKESDYIKKLYDAQGLSHSEQVNTTKNFNSIHDNIESLNKIFDGKGQLNTKSATESARTFLRSIGDDSKKALGMGQNTIRDLMKEIESEPDEKEKSTLLNNFKRRVEFRLITNRIKIGSKHKDPAVARSWRAVGASYLMRGCYDTTESDFDVQNYETGESFNYNGNKKMTNAFKNFIDTGEGLEVTKRGLSIHGYTANFSMDSSSGRHSMEMSGPVDQSALVKDSLEYSPTELMNKLLEVQELMFSHLIKE